MIIIRLECRVTLSTKRKIVILAVVIILSRSQAFIALGSGSTIVIEEREKKRKNYEGPTVRGMINNSVSRGGIIISQRNGRENRLVTRSRADIDRASRSQGLNYRSLHLPSSVKVYRDPETRCAFHGKWFGRLLSSARLLIVRSCTLHSIAWSPVVLHVLPSLINHSAITRIPVVCPPPINDYRSKKTKPSPSFTAYFYVRHYDNLLLGPIGRFLGTAGDAVAEAKANQAGIACPPSTAPDPL